MPNRIPPGWPVGLALAFALAITGSGLTGCAGGGAPRSSYSYIEDYEHGRYDRASVDAIRVVRDQGAPDRDVARLTAGLSAHAMGRHDEATVWLRPLTTNRKNEIAGKALATLGLIALEDGEHRTAAKSLSRAAGKLRADDSARAAMFAGDSYAKMGSFDAARLQYRLAQASAKSSALKREIRSRLGDGFTLQVGAFADRNNAERSRRRLSQNRSFSALGDPVVLQRIDARGTRLYLVQVGHFSTLRDAKAAQLRTGIGGIVTIAPSGAVSG